MKTEQTNEPILEWNSINWFKVETLVRRLQERIFKATQEENWQKTKNLQKLLVRSRSAKLLAIRRVTQENQGKYTPGIDEKTYVTPKERTQLSTEDFSIPNYHPQPVKRVYIPKSDGRRRPLGIPTIRDRIMQAIIKLALEAEWEARFERNSYGFRPGRCCMDAIKQLHITLSRKDASCWILDADITGCFDRIAHEPLLKKIPVFRNPLRRMLKAGVIELGYYNKTESGTPQGGVVSPLLANIALDGLEKLFIGDGKYRSPALRKGANKGISLIRYADDFVVTAPSREIIEDYVLPRIEYALSERGLEINQAKTRIVHKKEGFNFLGFTIKQMPKILLITPQKERVKRFLRMVKEFLSTNKQAKTEDIVKQLNSKIWGYGLYYRYSNAKRIFGNIDTRLWIMLYGQGRSSWCQRRHPNKGAKWVKNQYFTRIHNRSWVFGTKKGRLLFLVRMHILRYTKIKGSASPLDPTLRKYWKKRKTAKLNSLGIIRRKKRLLRLQDYKCRHCGIIFTPEDVLQHWKTHIHHILPTSQGGTDDITNLCLVHHYCHSQIHHAT